LAKDANNTGLSLDAGGVEVSHQEFEQSGFPGAIWSKDSGMLALGNRKRDAI
jgi:hypothetical protein